jgi:hypothetical protein
LVVSLLKNFLFVAVPKRERTLVVLVGGGLHPSRVYASWKGVTGAM